MSASTRPRRRWPARLLRGIVILAVLLVAGHLANTWAMPLDAPAPLEAALPEATPPADMQLVALATGLTHRSAAFAYRGGSLFDARAFTMTAVLVKHPRGDVLIDAGFGRGVDAHFASMPLYFRATTRYERGKSAAELLDAAGYDRGRLRAILLTHAHWDHASGAADFPTTPVWVTAEEHRFVREGGALATVARSIGDERYEEYTFEGGPYLGFPRSHDVHGDGAIVVVPAPGHTPGSVVVFVTQPGGARHAFVGDLVWQREGIDQLEERPWMQRTLADDEPAHVRENILRMAAIGRKFPEIEMVPAHDARGFERLPKTP